MEPSQDDGFKWFGEGFEGFPKRLPEDCVEYAIYVVDEEIKTTAQLLSKLNEILKFANEAGKKLFKDYIWQRDEFSLKINPDITKQNAATTTKSNPSDQKALPDTTNTPLHLLGRTNFGDSIADEWLIVHFLLTLSTHFPTAWMRVHDSDGEFLLIEAASALPKWLNPEVADNRVWLNNGHLRIIPPSANNTNTSPNSAATNLTLPTALSTILTAPSTLTISPYIEDEAFARTRAYPASIASTFHHTILPLPRKLAVILHRLPAAIAPAIEAFYLRDPVSLRPLMARDARALRFPPEDFVRTSVKVPRVGFAQLRGQVFAAPPAWAGAGVEGQEEKWSMGMKLACGFEMMLADEGAFGDRRVVREVGVLVGDVESGEEGFPGDGEVEGWGMRDDGEEWLDVDYGDFEEELAGKKGKGGKTGGKGGGFGDVGAQENLRRMVRRFEEFAEGDDEAGLDGVGEDDDVDDEDEDDDSSVSSSGEDKDGSFDEAEFERAMKEMMGMPAADIEKSGLLEEARRLALEDEKEGDGQDDMDEDEETRKVMELMEKELKGHGALNLDNERQKKSKASGEPKPSNKAAGKKPAFFGPERPPGMVATTKQFEEEADEEIGPGDGELSSGDEDYNDVDLGLAQNMLEAFKGQAGMSGPAGNMMRAMGVNLPRDEGED